MTLSNMWLTLMLTLVFTYQIECIHPHGDQEKRAREIIPQAFSAMMPDSVIFESASSPVTVPFEKVVTNIGNGFDPVSSHFLVQDNGHYFFAFNFVSGQSKFADVRLSINGQHVMSAMAIAGQHLGSNQGIFTLQSGDRVFLELQPHGMIANSDSFACFSGYHLNTTSAFTVTRTSTFTSGIVPFDNIITNIGNGYNSVSHKFTVPISGMYLFIFNSIGYNGSYNRLYLTDNGTHIVATYNSDHGATTAQNSLILSLEVNKELWLTNTNRFTNASFTGQFLFSMDEKAEKIAFSVGKTTNTQSCSSPVQLIFDHEFLNEGLGFHFGGSHFEAPIDGIYMFFFNSLGYGSNKMLVYLYHNSQKIAAIYGSPYPNPTGGNHIIVRLLQLDSVWLDQQPNSYTHSSAVPNTYATFSGLLLYSI